MIPEWSNRGSNDAGTDGKNVMTHQVCGWYFGSRPNIEKRMAQIMDWFSYLSEELSLS